MNDKALIRWGLIRRSLNAFHKGQPRKAYQLLHWAKECQG
jgi:hypothetical protein